MPPAIFRALAKEYGPIDNFRKVLRNTYGLERVVVNTHELNYKVIDEARYIIYKLKWE